MNNTKSKGKYQKAKGKLQKAKGRHFIFSSDGDFLKSIAPSYSISNGSANCQFAVLMSGYLDEATQTDSLCYRAESHSIYSNEIPNKMALLPNRLLPFAICLLPFAF